MKSNLVASAAFGLKALAASIFGGVVDSIYVTISGIDGGTEEEQEAAALAVLEAMKLSGTYTGPSGSAQPFISGDVVGEHFRDLCNHEGGYITARGGLVIPTERYHLGRDEGFSLNLAWSGFSADDHPEVSFEAATVEVHRLYSEDVKPEGLHPVFAAEKHNGGSQRYTQLVPNVIRAYYAGDTLVKSVVTIDGKDSEQPGNVSRVLTGMTARHEQETIPDLVQIHSADPLVAATEQPTFTVTATDGVVFMIGLRPDANAASRAAQQNANNARGRIQSLAARDREMAALFSASL